jgi:hypothetical protein
MPPDLNDEGSSSGNGDVGGDSFDGSSGNGGGGS